MDDSPPLLVRWTDYLPREVAIGVGVHWSDRAGPGDATAVDHVHDFDELVLVVAGTGLHHLGETVLPVRAGDVFVVGPDRRHHFTDREHLRLYNLMFDRDRLPLAGTGLTTLPGFRAIFDLEPRVRLHDGGRSRPRLSPADLQAARVHVEAMLAERRQAEPGHLAAMQAHFILLLRLLAVAYGTRGGAAARPLVTLGALLGWLERESGRPIGLDEMAARAGMPRSTFVRRFRQATGDSPVRWLNHHRVERALALARRPGTSLTAAAIAAGFSDGNYFSRVCRDLTGRSPREHLRNAR